jgi:hypothetical protein
MRGCSRFETAEDAVGVFLGAVSHLFAKGILAIDLAKDADDVV